LEEGDYGESMVAAVRNVGAITKAKKGWTKPWVLYLYPGVRPTDGFSEEASKISAFNALT
jgi:hypothetical protein